MQKFLGNRRKRQLLRSLSSDPVSEGHPVDRDNFSVLNETSKIECVAKISFISAIRLAVVGGVETRMARNENEEDQDRAQRAARRRSKETKM